MATGGEFAYSVIEDQDKIDAPHPVPEREPAAVRAMGFSVASLLMKLRPGAKRQCVR